MCIRDRSTWGQQSRALNIENQQTVSHKGLSSQWSLQPSRTDSMHRNDTINNVTSSNPVNNTLNLNNHNSSNNNLNNININEGEHDDPSFLGSNLRFNKCFCFLKLHPNIVHIIYGDIVFFLWTILIALASFTRPSTAKTDYVLKFLSALSALIQLVTGLQSLKEGLPNNNYLMYKRYLIAKFVFILINITDHVISPTLLCFFEVAHRTREGDAYCSVNSNIYKFSLTTGLAILQIYLWICLKTFCNNTERGDYGPIGIGESYIEEEDENEEGEKCAVTVICQGFRISNYDRFLKDLKVEKAFYAYNITNSVRYGLMRSRKMKCVIKDVSDV
eukprot:TRINITY_DN3339_c0_g1_i1.p1 TRINITY_DN3339_c0_g1~~TRINITY_DN3339_c0_g1_i1.p1  ORF type:complete len:361 (-),score=53.40 TRINITY_DN3339_c0_g1_i1:171-1166(-)